MLPYFCVDIGAIGLNAVISNDEGLNKPCETANNMLKRPVQ